MARIEQFLETKARAGAHHSRGSFSLDPARAAQAMALGSQPSPLHYLARVVMAANRLDAAEVRLSLGLSESILSFAPPSGEGVKWEEVARHLANPTEQADHRAGDLALSLLGAISSGATFASWEFAEGSSQARITLDGSYRLENWVSDVAHPIWRFRVKYRWNWRLWEMARRRGQAIDLVRRLCAFSPAALIINGGPLKPPASPVLNEHLRELHGSHFNVGTGVMETVRSRVAATLTVFDRAEPGEAALAMTPPSETFYSREANGSLVWSPALRTDNSSRPDGVEVGSWILKFVDRDGRDESASGVRFRAVVAMNIHGPGNMEPPRLMVVRHGVLVFEEKLRSTPELETLRGCSVILADDQLTTDLGGFGVVNDEKLQTRLAQLQPLLGLGQQVAEEAEESVFFC